MLSQIAQADLINYSPMSSQPATTAPKPRQASAEVTAFVAFLALYFVAGKFGLSLAYLNASASPVWPPTGIALAALLLWGYRLWPAIYLGAFLVNLTTQGTVLTSLAIATGNTLEAVLGAFLVHRFADGPRACDKAMTILRFVALAALFTTAVSASCGVTSLCLAHYAPWTQYRSIWTTWWLGDAMSDLTIAPLVLVWATHPFPRFTRPQTLEAITLLLAVVIVGAVVFPVALPFPDKHTPIDYLALLPLLWAAFRFGHRGAVTAAIFTSGIALAGALGGVGPFIKTDPNTSLLLTQAFIGTLTLTALLLAAVVSAHQQDQREMQNLSLLTQERLTKANEQLEQRVAERTTQLRETNAELEAFSYSLSHDLRSPLRTIRNFTQFALENSRDSLGPHVANLEKVLAASRRMDRLIQDVLAFSRVSRQELNLHLVEIDSLVQAIASERPEWQSPFTQIQLQPPLPPVRGDEASLTQCLTNLLDNAIKFVPPGVTPQVLIRSEPVGGKIRFWFEDNGIGIDPQSQEKIFELFQRGHSNGQYSGSGLGLAIVRKAVERMGGSVGVVSEPGKGSRFWLELPCV